MRSKMLRGSREKACKQNFGNFRFSASRANVGMKVISLESYELAVFYGIIALTFGVLHSHIRSGGRETEVAEVLFTCFFSGSPEHLGAYYISFERYSQGDHSAVGIVRNGAVLMEIFKK